MDKKRAVLALVDSIVSVEEQKAGGLVKGGWLGVCVGRSGGTVWCLTTRPSVGSRWGSAHPLAI